MAVKDKEYQNINQLQINGQLQGTVLEDESLWNVITSYAKDGIGSNVVSFRYLTSPATNLTAAVILVQNMFRAHRNKPIAKKVFELVEFDGFGKEEEDKEEPKTAKKK